jgi:hypothetical protein
LPADRYDSWLLHDDGFNGDFYSEIDIVESVSYLTRNEITLNTKPAECTMTAEQGTGEVHGTNCDYGSGGCSAVAPPGTFGDSLNQGGGGIWATQVEAEGIKIWHFRRSAIPGDIASDIPDPNKWGKPVLSLLPQNCDISKAWTKMKIVGLSSCSYEHSLTIPRSSTSPSAESLPVAQLGMATPSAAQRQAVLLAMTTLPRVPLLSTRCTS